MRHHPRAFVQKLDFVTTLGHGPTGRERRELGVATAGPQLLVTDLCMFQPDHETNELTVGSLHPGVTRDRVRENTGWDVRFASEVRETVPPTGDELEVLRELNARTSRAHGKAAPE